MNVPLYIGKFWWKKEDVDKETLIMCNETGIYWTGIKGKPFQPEFPDYCWAITNKFDPAVVAGQQNSE